MIVYPARHIFEAKFPSLEEHEEEIFYPHPIYDIKCNQLGALYYEEGKYAVYDKTGTSVVRDQITRKNCGSKLRIIWECYTGKISPSPHFFYANSNPLDTRKENLVLAKPLTDKEREPYLKNRKAFVLASVKHLIKIEQRMAKMGVDKEQLYLMLMLPYWLKTAREKKGETFFEMERLSAHKAPTTVKEANEVEKLFLQGQTIYAITKRMDWVSSSRVKKIIKDRGLTR